MFSLQLPVAILLVTLFSSALAAQQSTPAKLPQPPSGGLRPPDIFYVPTPQNVVDAMLALAKVTANDTVYDLGCGDGRILITAAKRYGAHAVGVDIDPERVEEARANVRAAGVEARVTILVGDLFKTDISRASVVTLYLAPLLNEMLIPKLHAELRPGSRVVSHDFDMGESWPPEKMQQLPDTKIYLWIIR